MDKNEFLNQINLMSNEDTRDLAKVNLEEFYNTYEKQINDLTKSVNVLREQNSKLAMRITGQVEEPVNEKSEEELKNEETENNLKEFIKSI